MHKSLGIGVGLRRSHYDDILKSDSPLPDWFEIISENFMSFGGTPQKVLQSLKNRNIPIIAHGVGLSLGSIDPLNQAYMAELKELLAVTDSEWFSDHLCFSSSFKHQYHDLLPLVYTDESLKIISDRIKKIQDYFQKPFAIENISYYGQSKHNTMSEHEFIRKLTDQTGCNLLLDLNNIYVNSLNHKIDPDEFLNTIDLDKVIQIHLAGHWDRGDIVIDTHGDYIPDNVWKLYRSFLRKIKRPVSTLIEWDHDIPDYTTLLEEADKAKRINHEVFGE